MKISQSKLMYSKYILFFLLILETCVSLFAQSTFTTRPSGAITTSPTTKNNTTSRSNAAASSSSDIYQAPTRPAPSSAQQRSTTSQVLAPTSNSMPAVGALAIATDPSYKLSVGDEVTIDVHGEGDMSSAQRIDQNGHIRLPYLGEVTVGSKTVRESEAYLEQIYIEKKYLRKPLVNINVREYSSRQVNIIGQVNSPGIFHLPRESDFMEIVDLIMSVGGFTRAARSNAVEITRMGEDGKENVIKVDVESMINNSRNALKSFKIYPGDRLLIKEKVW